MKKNIIYLLSVLFLANFTIKSQNIPLFINNDEKLFKNIIKTIEKSFPQGTEILLYDFFFINMNSEDEEYFNSKLYNYFKNTTKVVNIKTVDKIINLNDEIKETLLNFPSEEEIIYSANYFKFDCLILINISKLKIKRRVFDSKQKKIIDKPVYLLQGNLINPENHKIYYRLYDFFYME